MWCFQNALVWKHGTPRTDIVDDRAGIWGVINMPPKTENGPRACSILTHTKSDNEEVEYQQQ
jgi:hypothetical protein